MAGLGMFIAGIGYVAGGAIWLYTAFWFFADGQTLLGVIALVIPPADLVLPFLISPTLGLLALGTVALMFIGSAIGSAGEK